MEPGYYIPEPEEFHIGFEFERQQIVPEYDNQWRMKVKKLVFTKEYFTSNAIRYNFFEDLKEGKIRVKSLDQEDIESLGWKVNYHSYGRNYLKGDFSLGYTYDKLRMEISHEKEGRFFLGEIKNKSELTVIMKQLGI